MEKTRLFIGLLVWSFIIGYPADNITNNREVEALPSTSFITKKSAYFTAQNERTQPSLKLEEKIISPVGLPIKIKIPKIGLNTSIEAVGYSSKGEWIVPQNLPATPRKDLNIGGGKNVSVWGHRKGIFRHLGELELGDEVVIYDLAGGHVYQVEKKHVVTPQDIWVMNETPDYQITFITCDPIDTEEERLIISAKLRI